MGAITKPSRTDRSGRWAFSGLVIFPKKTFSTSTSM